VAALLLESKPYQTAIDMTNRLNFGADKAGGYSYGGLLKKVQIWLVVELLDKRHHKFLLQLFLLSLH